MKKLILAILVLCGTLPAPGDLAKASGAIVVFLQVRSQDYIMTTASRDKAFNSTALFNVLESSAPNLYVARIDPYLYRWVSYYGAYNYDVALNFNEYQNITFHYYTSLQAFIGFTENNETVVLLPQTAASAPNYRALQGESYEGSAG